jgi:hypothetical protein
MLPTKFRFIWPCGFREEDFLEINQSETRMACGGQVVNRPERNQQSLGKKSSPLKQLSQINRNLIRSIYGRSFIEIDNFVPIR